MKFVFYIFCFLFVSQIEAAELVKVGKDRAFFKLSDEESKVFLPGDLVSFISKDKTSYPLKIRSIKGKTLVASGQSVLQMKVGALYQIQALRDEDDQLALGEDAPKKGYHWTLGIGRRWLSMDAGKDLASGEELTKPGIKENGGEFGVLYRHDSGIMFGGYFGFYENDIDDIEEQGIVYEFSKNQHLDFSLGVYFAPKIGSFVPFGGLRAVLYGKNEIDMTAEHADAHGAMRADIQQVITDEFSFNPEVGLMWQFSEHGSLNISFIKGVFDSNAKKKIKGYIEYEDTDIGSFDRSTVNESSNLKYRLDKFMLSVSIAT